MKVERIASKVSAGLAHPIGIIAVPIFCGAWLLLWSVNSLTLALSVIALTFTQIVMLSQRRGDEATHVKLDAIIAGTDADDNVAGIEKLE